MRAAPLAALALLATVACHPTPRPPQLGITTLVVMTDLSRHEGELLAVHRDSLVLMVGNTLRWLPLSGIKSAMIDRRVLGVSASVRGMALAGLATGTALMISCMSADSEACVVLIPIGVGVGVIVGFIFGLETDRFRYATFTAPTAEQLRPWARYPQGMPEGYGGGPPSSAVVPPE